MGGSCAPSVLRSPTIKLRSFDARSCGSTARPFERGSGRALRRKGEGTNSWCQRRAEEIHTALCDTMHDSLLTRLRRNLHIEGTGRDILLTKAEALAHGSHPTTTRKRVSLDTERTVAGNV